MLQSGVIKGVSGGILLPLTLSWYLQNILHIFNKFDGDLNQECCWDVVVTWNKNRLIFLPDGFESEVFQEILKLMIEIVTSVKMK